MPSFSISLVKLTEGLAWFRVFRKSVAVLGDSGTRGLGDSGTWGRGDVGTRGRGDVGTRGRGDAATHFRSMEFQKWDNIAKKVELLLLFCFSSTS